MAQGTSNTAEQLLQTAERRAFVLERRAAGDSWPQVAAAAVHTFGAERLPNHWSERYAHKDFTRELERRQEENAETAEHLRDLQQVRIERMLQGLWSKAITGEEAAVDKALKLLQRQAKLFGLDEPERFEQAVSVLQSADYADLRTAIMNALEPYPEARAAAASALAGDDPPDTGGTV